jgi:hypothetical protein
MTANLACYCWPRLAAAAGRSRNLVGSQFPKATPDSSAKPKKLVSRAPGPAFTRGVARIPHFICHRPYRCESYGTIPMLDLRIPMWSARKTLPVILFSAHACIQPVLMLDELDNIPMKLSQTSCSNPLLFQVSQPTTISTIHFTGCPLAFFLPVSLPDIASVDPLLSRMLAGSQRVAAAIRPLGKVDEDSEAQALNGTEKIFPQTIGHPCYTVLTICTYETCIFCAIHTTLYFST